MGQARKLGFGGFVLDATDARLTVGGRAVPLAPKVFDVLCCLVGRAGQLVTKDQLFDAVWQQRFVSESVLKDHISDLRHALGDQARAPRYIETVSRRGYRFIAPVHEISDIDADGARSVLFSVTSQPPDEGEQRAPFVGRETALGELERHWRRALAGER